MIMSYDQYTLRKVKQLAKKECANYASGYCLPHDRPCHVVNSAYRAIPDGAVNCDYFLFAVLPLQPELNKAVWYEIFKEVGQTGVGWKRCACCHDPFVAACNRQRYCTVCGAEVKQERNRVKQRHYRARQKTTL